MLTRWIGAAAMLTVALGGCGEEPARGRQPTAADLAVPTPALASADAVEDLPPEPVTIALPADASIVTDEGPIEFDGLAERLARVASRPEDRGENGNSRRNFVLRVDPRLPWQVVLWVLNASASKGVRGHRFFFAVRPSDGSAEGCLSLFLPEDRGCGEEQDRSDSTDLQVEVLPDETRLDRGSALQDVLHALGASGKVPQLQVKLAVAHEPTTATGSVLATLDLLRRAGVRNVLLAGWGPPPSDRADEAGPPRRTWLQRWVEAHPATSVGFALQIGEHLTRGGPSPGVPLPPAPPRAHQPVATETRVRHYVPENAVDRALRWLEAHQSPDGRWEAAGFDGWCGGRPNGGARPDGLGKRMYDVGVSGLALLAFLGAGYAPPGSHEFSAVVRRGLAYLQRQQDAEGCIGTRNTQHFIYNHALATLTLCEACRLAETPSLARAAAQAVQFVQLCRNPISGWRYGIKPGDTDTSVTTPMTVALWSARLWNTESSRGGRPEPVTLDPEMAPDVRAWIERMTDRETGRVGYIQSGQGPARPQEMVDRFPNEKSEAMTAAGMLCRIALGEDVRASEALQKGAALCLEHLPRWDTVEGTIDFVYWHWGTLALFQMGGEAWKRWEAALVAEVLPHQRTDGAPCDVRGSWDPVDPWGPDGGRVYSTALMCLAMEVVYRYDRVFGTSSR